MCTERSHHGLHGPGEWAVLCQSPQGACADADAAHANCIALNTSCVRVTRLSQNCSCFAQARRPAPPCLFGDMRPAKLLAIMAACRALGVTHIVEQGRYGGLSAWLYSLHGFRVSSVELLPLSEVSEALRHRAPEVKLVDGDGRAAVQQIVRSAPATERLAVIFDGEKRQTAYETYLTVKGRIVLAAFDDTNLDDGAFPRLLRDRGENAWHTWDCAFMERHSDAAPLAQLSETLRAATATALQARDPLPGRHKPGFSESQLVFHGGMEDLSRFHTTLVRGSML